MLQGLQRQFSLLTSFLPEPELNVILENNR
jgi:hypothetical protein